MTVLALHKQWRVRFLLLLQLLLLQLLLPLQELQPCGHRAVLQQPPKLTASAT
jgi:hypothetical protein